MKPLKGSRDVLLFTTLVISSCDFIYGVNRRAPIPAAPDFTCVERVIRAAPGVENVRYSQTQGSRPLTWTGLKPPTGVHTFFYRDAQVLGVLQITVEYDGKTNFAQTLVDINRKPPQALIDASRPVMQWIEQRLESDCSMTGLTNAIKEDCPGVECPPLRTEKPNS
jgi:hypothetical protein